MISIARHGIHSLVRIAIAVGCLALLASCSGAVSGPPASGGPLFVSPSAATLYTDLPTTFVVTGGNGSYLITSSDQSAIPFTGGFEGNAFTIVPGPVAVDTPVTLTVRDTGSATPVTAELTVKPRTVSNVVTIIPSASQSDACGSAICAGGDAEVRVVLAQAGVPLVNREVRFDVVSGDFRVITSAPGTAEALSLTGSTLTDSSGTARIRIRALSNADAQTGLLQITDVSSGSFTRTGIAVAPSSNAPLSAQPSTIAFVGSDSTSCANGIGADVLVFGGRPPYSITQPGTFSVTPLLLTSNPGRFTVRATGQCTPGSPIAVVDSNGASAIVNASNALGSEDDIASPLVVAPAEVTLESCNQTASIAIAGGTGNYLAASGHSGISAEISSITGVGARATIRRVRGPLAVTSPVTVGISDGREAVEVTVKVGLGAQQCP